MLLSSKEDLIPAYDAEKAQDEMDDVCIHWMYLFDSFESVFNFYRYHIQNREYKKPADMDQDIIKLRQLIMEFENHYRIYDGEILPLTKQWYIDNNWPPDPVVQYIWHKYGDMFKRVQVNICIFSCTIMG